MSGRIEGENDLIQPIPLEIEARNWLGRLDDSEAYFELYEEGLVFLANLLDQRIPPSSPEDSFSHVLLLVRDTELIRNTYGAGRQGLFHTKETVFYSSHDRKKVINDKLKEVSPLLAQPALISLAFYKVNAPRWQVLERSLSAEGIDWEHPVIPFVCASLVINQAKSDMIDPIHNRIKRTLDPQVEITIANKAAFWEEILRKTEYSRGFAEAGNKALWEYAERIFGNDYRTIGFLWHTPLFVNQRALPKRVKRLEFYRALFRPLIQKNYQQALEVQRALVSQFPEAFTAWLPNRLGIGEEIGLERSLREFDLVKKAVRQERRLREEVAQIEALKQAQALVGKKGKTKTDYLFEILEITPIGEQQRVKIKYPEIPRFKGDNKKSIVYIAPTTLIRYIRSGRFILEQEES